MATKRPLTIDAGRIKELSSTDELGVSLGQLTDVNTTGAEAGEVLSWDGTTWAPATGPAAANGLPVGGNPGEYLVKDTATDFDVSWTDRVNAKTIYERVKNVSGSTLQKGTPVYKVGITGNTPTVAAARADDPDKLAMAVLDETLLDQAEGVALILGEIKGVDTSSFATGDFIYLGAAGGYTNVKPTGSDVAVQFLGVVFRAATAPQGSGFITGTLSPDQVKFQSGSFYGWNGTDWVELATAVRAVPSGGTTGQVLAKVDNTNYNTAWVTPTVGATIDDAVVFSIALG